MGIEGLAKLDYDTVTCLTNFLDPEPGYTERHKFTPTPLIFLYKSKEQKRSSQFPRGKWKAARLQWDNFHSIGKHLSLGHFQQHCWYISASSWISIMKIMALGFCILALMALGKVTNYKLFKLLFF